MNPKINLISFHLNNFRVFDKNTQFDLAPISILTGTNSSGKSSVTKALALLVKSYQNKGLSALDFMTSNLNLFGFNSIKNNVSDKSSIDFKLCFDCMEDNYELNLSYKDNYLHEFEICKNGIKIQSMSVDSSFISLPEKFVNKEKIQEVFHGLSSEAVDEAHKKILNFLSSDFECHGKLSNEGMTSYLNYSSNFSEKHKYKVIDSMRDLAGTRDANIYNPETGKEEVYTVNIGSNPKLGDIIPELAIEFGLGAKTVIELLDFTVLTSWTLLDRNLLSDLFSQFKFIGAIRANQYIIYTQANSPDFFEIISNYLADGNSTNANAILKKWLVEEFSLFKLEDSEKSQEIFKIDTINGVGYLVKFLVNGVWTDLSSLGYGVAQLFPMILKITTRADGIFVVEEPEANLHPALQSKLADFFLDVIKPTEQFSKLMAKLQQPSFIIETHSEYLIRKLQYLTASDSNLDSKDCIIYYFYPPDGVPKNEVQVKKININNDGSLSDNFGEGFSDEATSWKFELLRLNNLQKN